jgi:hypothetical protein
MVVDIEASSLRISSKVKASIGVGPVRAVLSSERERSFKRPLA